MQQVTIIGNVGNEPKTNATKTGTVVCSFNVAATKVVRGEKVTTWFRVATFAKLAEVCEKYVVKGMKVAIVGSIFLNTYTGNDGQNRASLEVNADSVEFLSPRDEQRQETADERAGFVEVTDSSEQLPF